MPVTPFSLFMAFSWRRSVVFKNRYAVRTCCMPSETLSAEAPEAIQGREWAASQKMAICFTGKQAKKA